MDFSLSLFFQRLLLFGFEKENGERESSTEMGWEIFSWFLGRSGVGKNGKARYGDSMRQRVKREKKERLKRDGEKRRGGGKGNVLGCSSTHTPRVCVREPRSEIQCYAKQGRKRQRYAPSKTSNAQSHETKIAMPKDLKRESLFPPSIASSYRFLQSLQRAYLSASGIEEEDTNDDVEVEVEDSLVRGFGEGTDPSCPAFFGILPSTKASSRGGSKTSSAASSSTSTASFFEEADTADFPLTTLPSPRTSGACFSYSAGRGGTGSIFRRFASSAWKSRNPAGFAHALVRTSSFFNGSRLGGGIVHDLVEVAEFEQPLHFDPEVVEDPSGVAGYVDAGLDRRLGFEDAPQRGRDELLDVIFDACFLERLPFDVETQHWLVEELMRLLLRLLKASAKVDGWSLALLILVEFMGPERSIRIPRCHDGVTIVRERDLIACGRFKISIC
ncbi:hypothetical protein KC327_g5 [Hortaea werneckii]|nr:hypothetical protein KC327_g5 [Hortaea werneckii]